jgi:NADP-dependent 3-hydroxy acid dehydrogenase YdfG
MKTFLITGASSGIGAATARRAVQAGYRVALAARSADKLADLAGELGGPDQAIAISCDVTDYQSQMAMVAQTIDAFGRIDVVFANAGIGATSAGTEHGDPDNWKAMILTNFYGCALTAKVCYEQLKANCGHILLTGSRAGRQVMKGSIYGATKWAVTGFGQNLRQEFAGTGVRVTLIQPGMVETPFFDTPPIGALSADDVAGAVLYAIGQPADVDVSEIMISPTVPSAAPKT